MSLIQNVKVINKNHIIFHHKDNYYYQSIDNDNKINIFNKNLMNIFLEQFSENIGNVTYDDITSISVLENHDKVIRNLPKKLKQLIIMSTYCDTIEFNNEVCLSIEHISIDKSNIDNFPDIRNCVNLKTCKIAHSAIDNFNLSYDLPNMLHDLNLQGNLMINVNFSYDKLLDKLENKTLRKINLSDNRLNYDEFPEKLRIKCNLIRQHTYIHNRIINRNVANDNIANIVHMGINGGDTPNNFFSSQNVHLSSINKSVLKSLDNIRTLIAENELKPVVLLLDDSFVTKFKNILPLLSTDSDQQLFNTYFINFSNYTVYNTICDDFNKPTKNSITNLTYKQTFEMIWSILCFKHRKGECNLVDVVNRIKIEINDGLKMCFTGKYNRLINSMVGIIEGVHVGFSEGEELQLEFGKLIQKFNNDKEYSFDKLLCDSKELLQYVKDEGLKQPWIDAIYDLQPDPETIEYNGKEYYRTFDYDILDLYDKTLIGYYIEKEEKIIYLHEFL